MSREVDQIREAGRVVSTEIILPDQELDVKVLKTVLKEQIEELERLKIETAFILQTTGLLATPGDSVTAREKKIQYLKGYIEFIEDRIDELS